MGSVQNNNHIYCITQSSETLFYLIWLFSLVFKLFFMPRLLVYNIVISNIFYAKWLCLYSLQMEKL